MKTRIIKSDPATNEVEIYKKTIKQLNENFIYLNGKGDLVIIDDLSEKFNDLLVIDLRKNINDFLELNINNLIQNKIVVVFPSFATTPTEYNLIIDKILDKIIDIYQYENINDFKLNLIFDCLFESLDPNNDTETFFKINSIIKYNEMFDTKLTIINQTQEIQFT